MQNDIRRRKKKAPIIIASVTVVFLGILLIVILLPVMGLTPETLPLIGVALIYSTLIAAIIVGVLLALRQRLQEIEGGEEDDAKKY